MDDLLVIDGRSWAEFAKEHQAETLARADAEVRSANQSVRSPGTNQGAAGMSKFLDVALSCLRRGWYVFPCWPETKEPMTHHGHKDASNDEPKVREWWTRTPNANVAIATGPSKLAVWDCDQGLNSESDLTAFLTRHDITKTYAVRTGRRDSYGVQLYYSDPIPSVQGWEIDGHSGDVKSDPGYVMAAGCVHPDTKETYEVLWDLPIEPTPNRVRALKGRKKERVLDPNEPITEWRNDAMIRILGKLRADGADDEMIRAFAYRTNETRMRSNPLDEDELEHIITNACRFPQGEPQPIAIIGGTKPPAEPGPPKDWRELFHSKEDALNAPPITFLIRDFLQREGVTAVAGPVRERKVPNCTQCLPCTADRRKAL